jgi:excisionase family DNA binding protein
MKIGTDIRSLIEDDAKHLMEALLSGELSPGNNASLAEHYNPQQLQQLTAEIIQYQLDNKSLALILPFLWTMKWLSLAEACVYARKSRNTLLKLIEEGRISGSRPEGSGEFIIDRESIDAYYNAEQDKLRMKYQSRRAS